MFRTILQALPLAFRVMMRCHKERASRALQEVDGWSRQTAVACVEERCGRHA